MRFVCQQFHFSREENDEMQLALAFFWVELQIRFDLRHSK
jgi:hypothetical protein